MRLSTRARTATGLVLALALVVSGCGDSDDGDGDAATSGDGGEAASDASGTVPIAGSSTVFPITALVAEDFRTDAPDADAVVESTGTGGGFADHFCLGETAINNASRAIADDEIDLCAENGVENIVELKVGIDGMAVLTSAANDAIAACLNFTELYALLGPESEATSWADANALVAEIGEHASGEEFPDVELSTAGPGTESGTYDSFIELALEDIAEERGVEPGVRADWTGNNDDNVIIQGLAGNQYSLGWVGYAYYTEIAGELRAFEVAGEDGECIAPEDDVIADGTYPLSRPLFVYVNLDKLDEDYGGALQAFVDYYVSDAGRELVTEAGYVQLTDDEWAATVEAWEAQAPNVG
jgi:phosphate transport system substrate-binding protein